MLRSLATFLLLCVWSFHAAAVNTDSLLRVYSQSGDDALRLSAMIDLAWEFRNVDVERSISFADEAAALALSRKDTAALASAYLRKTLTLRKLGHHQEALELNTKAVGLKRSVHDTLGLAFALGNLSQLNTVMGNYDQAIAHRLESIALLGHSTHTQHRITGLNNLAGIYASLEQHDKAVEVYQSCLALATSLNDSATVARTWYNLGASHFALQEDEQAEGLYANALKFAIRHGDQVGQARLYNSIGTLHYVKKDATTALTYFRQAEALYAQLGFSPELVMSYNNIAAAYAQQEDFEQSLSYYQKAATLADSAGNPKDLAQIYLNLSNTYETLKSPDSALRYFKLHTMLNDSLFNAEKNRQFLEVQEKYESAEKDRSIAELNQVKQSQQADIRIRNLLLAGSVLVVVLAFLFGVNYYQKLKAQRKLASHEAELSQKRIVDLLKDSELTSMNAFIDGETAERQRLAGELHDNLSSRLATVKLHYDYLGKHLKDEEHLGSLQKANALLGEVLSEIRQLAHELTEGNSGVLRKFGLVSAIEDLCQAISSSGALTVQMDAFQLEKRLPPGLELTLFRILQELVSNAVKHACATEVSLQLIRYDDHVSVIVSDNGVGFATPSLPQDRGMGLKSIESRITELGGSFTIDSQPGHGATCILEIPLENIPSNA